MWKDYIELVFVVILGGRWLINILTIKSQKKKAEADVKEAEAQAKKTTAEAKSIEADSDTKIVRLWEQYTDKKSATDGAEIKELRSEVFELKDLIKTLRNDVGKLTRALNEAKKCIGVKSCPVLLELNKEK